MGSALPLMNWASGYFVLAVLEWHTSLARRKELIGPRNLVFVEASFAASIPASLGYEGRIAAHRTLVFYFG